MSIETSSLKLNHMLLVLYAKNKLAKPKAKTNNFNLGRNFSWRQQHCSKFSQKKKNEAKI